MMPEEPTDYGWNQQGFNAAKAVAAKYGLKFMPATGLGYGDVHAELRELAEDGASLIIAHGAGYNTAAPEIGAEMHVPVAIVDRPKDCKPGAVADYTLSGHQGAYLAGVLAAKTTQTHVVGRRDHGRAALLEFPIRSLCARRSRDGPEGPDRLCGHRSRRLLRRRRRPARDRVGDRGGRRRDLRSGRWRELRHAAGGRDQEVHQRRQGLVHRRDRRQDADRQGISSLVRGLEPRARVFGDDRGSQGKQVRHPPYPAAARGRLRTLAAHDAHSRQDLGRGRGGAQADHRRQAEGRADLRRRPRFAR